MSFIPRDLEFDMIVTASRVPGFRLRRALLNYYLKTYRLSMAKEMVRGMEVGYD